MLWNIENCTMEYSVITNLHTIFFYFFSTNVNNFGYRKHAMRAVAMPCNYLYIPKQETYSQVFLAKKEKK